MKPHTFPQFRNNSLVLIESLILVARLNRAASTLQALQTDICPPGIRSFFENRRISFLTSQRIQTLKRVLATIRVPFVQYQLELAD